MHDFQTFYNIEFEKEYEETGWPPNDDKVWHDLELKCLKKTIYEYKGGLYTEGFSFSEYLKDFVVYIYLYQQPDSKEMYIQIYGSDYAIQEITTSLKIENPCQYTDVFAFNDELETEERSIKIVISDGFPI